MDIRRIALVGNGKTTKDSIGFDGEIWTTASVGKMLPRADCIFEVHREYDADTLNKYGCPIVMDGKHPEVIKCIDLRIDSLVCLHGPMFQFSYDYMFAFALSQHGKNHPIEIATFGIDLATDEEYNRFRQSFYYWVGLARGSGIKVTISQGSAIFNEDWQYCHKPNPLSRVREKIGAIDEKLAQANNQLDYSASAVEYLKGYRACLDDIARLGGQI